MKFVLENFYYFNIYLNYLNRNIKYDINIQLVNFLLKLFVHLQLQFIFVLTCPVFSNK